MPGKPPYSPIAKSLQQTLVTGQFVTPSPTPDYNKQVLGPLKADQVQEAAQAAKIAAQQEQQREQQAIAQKSQTSVQVEAPTSQVAPTYSGSHQDWMAAAGIAPSDYGYVDYIVTHESGWDYTNWNHSGSGAYGLGQALPASKMAPYGADYMTDPVAQLKWANAYAQSRYGSWAAAYTFWTINHLW